MTVQQFTNDDANHTVDIVTNPLTLFAVWSKPVRIEPPSGDLSLVFRTRDGLLSVATWYRHSGWSVWTADPRTTLGPSDHIDIPGRA